MLSKLLVCVMFLLTVFATAPARAVLTGETKNPTKSAPAAVGSYMLYLQAKQEMDYAAAINFLYDALKEDSENPSLTTEMFALLAFEGRLKEAVGLFVKPRSYRKNHIRNAKYRMAEQN